MGRNRALLAGLALVVAIAGVAGLVLIDEDDDEEQAAVTTTTTTDFLDTTSTTTSAGDVTTTTAPTTTSTTRATATTTTRAASSTTAATATTVPAAVCGSGRAAVSFEAKDLTTDALSSSFTPRATVDNQVSAPIEVEQIVIEVVFPGNDVRTVRFTTAGTVISPGTSASFTAEKLTTPKRYESVRFTRFTYFTQGRQATCRVTTP